MTQKRTVTKALLLAFLLLGGMIVSPVCAYYQHVDIEPQDQNLYNQTHFDNVYSVSFSKEGQVIHGLNIQQNIDTITTITLTYDDGSTVSGNVTYLSVTPFTSSYVSTSLGDVVSYGAFTDLLQLGQQEFALTYASNISGNVAVSTGFLLYHIQALGSNYETYYEVSGFDGNLITSVEITSTKEIDVLIVSSPVDVALKDAKYTSYSADQLASDWIAFAVGIASFVFGTVYTLFTWIKFFFVDNLLMTVSLYLALTMAYSFGRAKNMEQGLRKFFKFQRSFFEFILSLWNYLVQILASFRGIFRI
jgi:hypothetical protein